MRARARTLSPLSVARTLRISPSDASLPHILILFRYFYATRRSDVLRQHMLADTLLIPRLVLPYIDRCVQHALLLDARADTCLPATARGARRFELERQVVLAEVLGRLLLGHFNL